MLFSKCWQSKSQTVFHFHWCLQPGAMESTSDIYRAVKSFKPPLPQCSTCLYRREVEAVLTTAGLGNVVWSSYLHSGGAREVEDTNRRFRSLQPSPEKKQKVSTIFFLPVLFCKDLICWFSFKGTMKSHWFCPSCSRPMSSLMTITKEDHYIQAELAMAENIFLTIYTVCGVSLFIGSFVTSSTSICLI